MSVCVSNLVFLGGSKSLAAMSLKGTPSIARTVLFKGKVWCVLSRSVDKYFIIIN